MGAQNDLRNVPDEALIAEIEQRASQLDGSFRARLINALLGGDECMGYGIPAAQERLTEDPRLTVFSEQYRGLHPYIQARCPWEKIARKLLANGGKKLEKAQAMQGGGELFGIDKDGKALFKDKGVEPVMYGFDEKGDLITIYNRDEAKMKDVVEWANYFEIREAVRADGYWLFPSMEKGDEMEQVKFPFVASENREEVRMSWIESGTNFGSGEDVTPPKYVDFDPASCQVTIGSDIPQWRSANRGAMRMLRV